MIESMFGSLDIKEDLMDYTVDLRFNSQFQDEDLYLATLDERNLDRMIFSLTRIKEQFKKIKEWRKEIITKINLTKIYNDMKMKYHPYPTQMSRADAFGHALEDGIIDSGVYSAIREYYGNLWNYVGD